MIADLVIADCRLRFKIADCLRWHIRQSAITIGNPQSQSAIRNLKIASPQSAIGSH